MKIAAVTTFSKQGYLVYGQEMLRTFKEFWPDDIDFYVYYEGDQKPLEATSRAIWYPLDEDRQRRRFLATHVDHPINYRKQPRKFCHKVFAVSSVPRHGYDWLIWLDADLVFLKPITQEFLATVLPQDCAATYLGRRWHAHTEAGFLAYNLNKAGALLLDDMRRMYTSDQIMTLFQQHDCAVFDYCRQCLEHSNIKFNDLGEGKGPAIDIMAVSVLAPYMYHNKGPKRKRAAYGDVA